MRVVHFILFVVLPPAAFYGGYRLTDWVFRWKVIPYPSEPYGLAVGAGLAFWTLAVLMFMVGSRKKGGSR